MTDKNKKSRLTINQARKALGMIAQNYSDAQIEQILMHMRDIAELTYDDLYRHEEE